MRNYLESEEARGSLKSSNSVDSCNSAPPEYYRESVVMRPRSAVANGFTTPTVTEISSSSEVQLVQMRSKSADIRAAGPKRNSRGGIPVHVDLPSLPPVDERLSIDERLSADEFSRLSADERLLVDERPSSSRADSWSGSDTPTPDSGSINAFESDISTGTIKKRPPPGAFIPNGGIKLPIADTQGAFILNGGARLPLTDTTRQISGQKKVPSDASSLKSDGSSSHQLATEAEADSDEELPPPPPELTVDATPAEFPAPPSPIVVVNVKQPPSPVGVVNVKQNGYHAKTPSPVQEHPKTPSPVQEMPPTTIYAQPQKFAGATAGAAARPKPPPPPKRSENTKLTTVTQLPEILTTNGGGQVSPKGAGGEPKGAPPPPVKPKPSVPPKPAGSPQKPQACVPNGSSGSSGSSAFMNEIEAAMAKRRQKQPELQ